MGMLINKNIKNMKTISLAVLALIQTSTAVKLAYDESEGPTKVDLGDCDMHVVMREKDNGYEAGKAKFHGWTNPLGWADTGADDDKVIAQIDSKISIDDDAAEEEAMIA